MRNNRQHANNLHSSQLDPPDMNTVNDSTATRWGWLVVPAVIALGIYASISGLCSRSQTPEEYWSGPGKQLIEKARQDELEAQRRFQTAPPSDREAAKIGLDLATQVRKQYEETRDRNLGRQP